MAVKTDVPINAQILAEIFLAILSANRLVVTGFASRYRLIPKATN